MRRLSPLLAFILPLAIASPVAAAEDASARAFEPEPIEIVLLFHHRPSLRADPASLEDRVDEDLAAAWLWSRHQAPRRVEPDGLLKEMEQLRSGDSKSPVRRLRVRVPSDVERPETDLEVVAAPAAMYQQVPEAWLPRWKLSADGKVAVPRRSGEAWRLRLVGQGRGTGWQEVAPGDGEALLSPVAAGTVHTVIADADGQPLPDAYLTILEDLQGSTRPSVLSQQRGGDRGVIEIPALPADLSLTFVAGGGGHAARTFRAHPADLPATLRLPRGASLRGRLVDGDGLAMSGAELQAEGWLAADIPVRFSRRAESDDDGRWEIGSLPPRPLALLARHPGHASWHGSFELAEGVALDLGEVTLTTGAELAVVVHDDVGSPVAAATLSVRGTPPAVTDGEGRARLADLPASSSLTLHATAEGHLPQEVDVPPPWPREAPVTLTRAFTVYGRLLDEDLLPLAGGTARVEEGDSFRFAELGADGGFELELKPAVPCTLRFSSPANRQRVVEVEPGLPGEERDLGTVTPPPGVAVWGTVVSAADGTPVTGARVWLPRSSPDLLGSWLHGDLLETRSDELGRFQLGGLEGKPEMLRVDATGFARYHATVQPETATEDVDLGEIALSPGATVRVRVADEEAAQGAVARLDLRRRWMDLDMLTAPVIEGLAELPHAPSGEALLTVLADGELICEKDVVVPPEDDEVEVSCAADPRRVTGVVLLGDRPSGAGTLVWSSETAAKVMATILNLDSPLGARQQRTVGRGRPPVRVPVADDGSFVAERLAAGRWSVVWNPQAGAPAAPQVVDVPGGDEASVVVRIAGGVVLGRVSDAAGNPVEGAWVRDVDGGGVSRSTADGTFQLSGLHPGQVRLQARDGGIFSDVAEVWLEDGRPAEPVDLVVTADQGGRLAIQVWTEDELPAAGAFAFLDAGGRGLQVVSTDGGGRAELVLSAPYPRRVRLAAFHQGGWAFGAWSGWDDLAGAAELKLQEAGELLVTSDGTDEPSLSVLGPDGWNVSALLALLGVSPSVSPDHPFLLSGLPRGLYQIGDDRRTAAVEADHRVRVELE